MKQYANAFELLTSDSHAIKILNLKSEMMNTIIETIKSNGWTQKKAAEHLGLSQPRLSNLHNGKISKFSGMMLMNMLSKLGFTFEIKFTRTQVGIKQ